VTQVLSEEALQSGPPVTMTLPGQKLRHDGTVDNWYRYYEPELGRYLSPEPLAQSPVYPWLFAQRGMGMPQYSYGLNSPLAYSDSTGQFVWTLPMIFALYGSEIALALGFGTLGFGVGFGLGTLAPPISPTPTPVPVPVPIPWTLPPEPPDAPPEEPECPPDCKKPYRDAIKVCMDQLMESMTVDRQTAKYTCQTYASIAYMECLGKPEEARAYSEQCFRAIMALRGSP